MSLYQRQNCKTWYCYIVHKGERIRRSTGTADKEEAQRFHDQLKAQLWSEKRRDSAHTRTFKDAVILWLETGNKGLSDRYRIKALAMEDMALSDIDEDFLAGKLNAFKGSTRNRIINLIHAVLNCAVKRGWIGKVPHMARTKTNDKRIRWLTADEWVRLQAELPEHLLAMARFAIATGLRENNVIGLEWSQVDLHRSVCWVHGDQAKAGRPIGIPLSEEAAAAIESQKGKHERWVFTYQGNPVTRTSNHAWKKATERAGLGEYIGTGKTRKFKHNFRWHDFRHTWASWHVMNGTPLEVLQKLGGWKTLQMVMRYAHLAPEHLASFAGNAKPLRHSSTPQSSEIPLVA